MLAALVPILIAVAIVAVIIALKVTERRANARRRSQGLPPLTEEQKTVNVIDWTRPRK